MRRASTAKTVLEEELGGRAARTLWTANYTTVLPFTPQDFSIQALLPAVMYMFRWGHRRGTGFFAKAFKPDNSGAISSQQVADVLADQTDSFVGFEDQDCRAILADLLLTYCLENKGHKTGRDQEVIRVFPTHYHSSWIDLPQRIGHLRSVPEMIVAILTNQKDGPAIEQDQKVLTKFPTGQGFERNELLKHFATGVSQQESTKSTDITSDIFDEEARVGIDQLLTIRIANKCGASPLKLRGQRQNSQIPNKRPLGVAAATTFRRDFRTFLEAYGEIIPRQSLLAMLESCISLGLTNIFLSSALQALEWESAGKIPEEEVKRPWPLFVDASLGEDYTLRKLSEEHFADTQRRLDRLPVVLMSMRALEQAVYEDEDLRKNLKELQSIPHGARLLNFLGDIKNGYHDASNDIIRDLKKQCSRLAGALEEGEEDLTAVGVLRNVDINAATRIGEAVVILMGDQLQKKQFTMALDSCLMINIPNGLAKKRRVQAAYGSSTKTADARSIILSNSILDFLVHRYVRTGKGAQKEVSLSLQQFLRVLRDDYGLFVDQSPPTINIPTEILVRNKLFLERRLRDLGLLVGVNDAENMKSLVARFTEVESGE